MALSCMQHIRAQASCYGGGRPPTRSRHELVCAHAATGSLSLVSLVGMKRQRQRCTHHQHSGNQPQTFPLLADSAVGTLRSTRCNGYGRGWRENLKTCAWVRVGRLKRLLFNGIVQLWHCVDGVRHGRSHDQCLNLSPDLPQCKATQHTSRQC